MNAIALAPAATPRAAAALPGSLFPLGATLPDRGTNFAVTSAADGILLCLFDADGTETQIPLTERDGGVWHGFIPGVRVGRAYGYRATGPSAPGLRPGQPHGSPATGPYAPGPPHGWHPATLLVDPSAPAIEGEVRFGPEA